MLLITHTITGLALGVLLTLNLPLVIIGAVLPDIDVLLPVAHRTVFHSLTFMLAVSFILYWKSGKKNAVSFLIGFASHLVLDSVTYQGIQALWPLPGNFGFGIFNAVDSTVNLGIILAGMVLLLNKDRIIESLMKFEPKKVRIATYSSILSWAGLLVFMPFFIPSAGIDELLSNPYFYDEREVRTQGVICSEIERETSSSGNVFQVFNLCTDDSSILVWKLETIERNDLKQNMSVSLRAKFTLAFKEPELYMVSEVIVNENP